MLCHLIDHGLLSVSDFLAGNCNGRARPGRGTQDQQENRDRCEARADIRYYGQKALGRDQTNWTRNSAAI